jgi:hypothetical protein
MFSPLLVSVVVCVQLQFHWGLSFATAAFLPTFICLQINHFLVAPTRKAGYKRGIVVNRSQAAASTIASSAESKESVVAAVEEEADSTAADGETMGAAEGGEGEGGGEVLKPLKLRIQPEEEELLTKLRALVEEGRVQHEGISDQEWSTIFTCDQTMVKFLRARHNDLEKAAQMCIDSLCWRSNFTCDGVVGVSNLAGDGDEPKWRPSATFNRYIIRCALPIGREDLRFAPLFFSHDRQKHLVSVARVGALDLAGVYEELGEEQLLGCFVYCLEHTRRALLEHHRTTGVRPMLTAVVDLSGFGHHCVPPMAFLQKLLKMFQDNFPEILLRAVVVKAPWLFYGVWRVIQTFITKSMSEKIKIFGSDFADEVAAIVAPADIPVFLGGGLTWGDDGECKEVISTGGMVGGDK